MDKIIIDDSKDFPNYTYKNFCKMSEFINSLNLKEDDKLSFYTFENQSYDEIIEVNYKRLETDEEYYKRINSDKIKKEIRYKEYLKLKEEFEG